MYKLPYELSNNLRLTIRTYSWEILEKSQIWVEAQPSTQSPFQKLNFDNSNQKVRKNSRYQSFLDLSNFSGFLYFIPCTLSRIVQWFWEGSVGIGADHIFIHSCGILRKNNYITDTYKWCVARFGTKRLKTAFLSIRLHGIQTLIWHLTIRMVWTWRLNDMLKE